ncbi:MAG: type II toxin-antitoxin system HicB family antitoxin [Bacteroidota bacterium]
MLRYPIVLVEEDDGRFSVEVPDLPGCFTYGRTYRHALKMAEEAIEGFIEVLKEDGDSIPKPSKLDVVVRKKSKPKENQIFTTIKVAA